MHVLNDLVHDAARGRVKCNTGTEARKVLRQARRAMGTLRQLLARGWIELLRVRKARSQWNRLAPRLLRCGAAPLERLAPRAQVLLLLLRVQERSRRHRAALR